MEQLLNPPPLTPSLSLMVLFMLSTSSAAAPQSHPLSPDSDSASSPFRRVVVSVVFGASSGLILALLVILLIRCFYNYFNQTQILRCPVIFCPKIDPIKLQAALAEENHLLGSGLNGKYYKAVLENGLVLAVKHVVLIKTGSSEVRSKSGRRKMQQEFEVLAKLSHRNLMSLRAYVCEVEHCDLVYEFVSTGCLEDVMRKVRNREMQLDWDVRLRIATGVIKGLHYLHFSCVPQMLHYDLKLSNVMLDAEYEPRLADCGLAKALPHLHTACSPYAAPECFQDHRYTDKSDVFSFGVVLAVLLTGRDPKDLIFGEATSGINLIKWLAQLQHAGEAREALDKSILGGEVEEDEMLMAVKISVKCCSDLPQDRPWSDELVNMLTQLHSF